MLNLPIEDAPSRSSRNALKTGLYTARDFIREGEHADYNAILADLMNDLCPTGPLEDTLAAEIMGATWRLRRCRLVEEDLASRTAVEPMTETGDDDPAAKIQKSVDRARAQSHRILRQCTAELRRLQTEHRIREELGCDDLPILTDLERVLRVTRREAAPAAAEEPNSEVSDYIERELAKLESLPPAVAPVPDSFCKPAPAPQPRATEAPRNALCPCGSGLKFKRCCARTGAGWEAEAAKAA